MFEARRLPRSSAVMLNGRRLKLLIDALKDLVREAILDCSSEGISLQALDSSHVALVVLLLCVDDFHLFQCDNNRSLGINLANMHKVLQCCNNDDTVTLKAEGNAADQMTLEFENESQDRISVFNLNLMDINAEHLHIPVTEFKCVVRMPACELLRACRDLSFLGDTVTIAVDENSVKFSTTGEMGTGNMTLRQNDSVDTKEEDRITIKMEEAVTLKFALRYLNFFTKATSLSSHVTLSLSADEPLVVEYTMENLSHLRYYLAPKIEDEEA